LLVTETLEAFICHEIKLRHRHGISVEPHGKFVPAKGAPLGSPHSNEIGNGGPRVLIHWPRMVNRSVNPTCFSQETLGAECGTRRLYGTSFTGRLRETTTSTLLLDCGGGKQGRLAQGPTVSTRGSLYCYNEPGTSVLGLTQFQESF